MSTPPPPTSLNLKAVVHETGLSPDVLRAWERRYGVPQPVRSTGRQRLYSPSDVAILKWLVARQGEGMTISRAVALWREREATGAGGPEVRAGESEAQTSAIADLRRDWLAACLAFDRQTGDSVLARAFALYPVLVVCEDILLGGLAEIGARWYLGEVTVLQEHFTAALAAQQVARLIGATPVPWKEGRVFIGCVADEHHFLAPLLFTLILRGRGWDAVFLGANVPTNAFGQLQQQPRPTLVVLAAERLATAARLLESGEVLRALGLPLAYGGQVFDQMPSLRKRIPGTFLGETLGGVASEIDQIIGRPPVEASEPVPAEFTAASAAILEHLPSMEAIVGRELGGGGDPATQTLSQTLNLARNLAAGLRLGSVESLRAEIAWAAGWLRHRGILAAHVRDYLLTYRGVLSAQLGDRGALAVTWLDRLIDEGGTDG